MRITVIGLGIIGGVWAAHLAEDGHEVRTWNRTFKPGAPGFTADLVAAVTGAELVAIVVADPPAVADVLERIAPVLVPGVVVAQHSTVGVEDTRAYAALVADRGADFLDMPFTGSKPAAEQRQNIFFVGGAPQTLAKVAGVYARLAKAVLPIGGIGQAMAIKLAFNLLIANLNQAQCEALTLATRAGIPAETFFSAFDLNVGRSPLVDLKKAKYLAGDYSPQFSVKHMHKDLRLALAFAGSLGLRLDQTATVERAYATAEAEGRGDQDFAALLEVVKSAKP